ncbi:restriction endonuclease subunit S [Thermoflavimicrobium dichotomicum]|uniref:Type I restriction modification DNA specificity domain-containing protein n=1 Tax=Thermoflavimicrobium dichotomicum TaxID=46223 RepID=A0A1I3TLI3_9BACL|nr:restriction endonuclease subunit S [Thermoflavimicrobium dichotomicum]SFJ71383.1 Type I restriction modification DNA specificity domain-containing protein [Thermoflavimicrobium dichotomicum]
MEPLTRFKQLLIEREVTELRQIATELLRVHLTKEACLTEGDEGLYHDEHTLYERMKEETEQRLGYFYGDPDWFKELYVIGEQIDFLQGFLALFEQDRTGVIVSPSYLTDYFTERIIPAQVEKVLIPEAHKFLPGLSHLIQVCPDKQFVLTAQEKWLVEVLRFLYRDEFHVTIHHLSIYSSLDFEQDFDYILAIPAFGVKMELDTDYYFTRESEGIAVQNLLDFLSEQGEFTTIIPSRFTFSGGGFAKLRKWILRHAFVKSIHSLPDGTLRNYKGKSYLLTLTREPNPVIELGSLHLNDENQLALYHLKAMDPQSFREREDWRLDALLSHADVEQFESLQPKKYKVVKLGEIAELFRGKSITKNKLQPGDVHVLNISNIEDGEILWDAMDTINEEIRKVRRYELEVGDVVITCRGTQIKVAIVRELPFYTIASANLIVIRCNSKEVESEYLKIFLESPVGEKLVQTFQRGTTVMNIHPADLGELKIPMPTLADQRTLVQKYQRERQLFLEARRRWEQMRQTIYDQLIK